MSVYLPSIFHGFYFPNFFAKYCLNNAKWHVITILEFWARLFRTMESIFFNFCMPVYTWRRGPEFEKICSSSWRPFFSWCAVKIGWKFAARNKHTLLSVQARVEQGLAHLPVWSCILVQPKYRFTCPKAKWAKSREFYSFWHLMVLTLSPCNLKYF